MSLPVLYKFRRFLILVLALILVSCGAGPAREKNAQASCQTQRVIDGDSVLAICDGEAIELRLVCIDAPELKQKPYGQQAKSALVDALGARFDAQSTDKDRYGRTLATLWRGEREINLELVLQGDALVYRHYCGQPSYLRAENDAFQAKRGVWDERFPFVAPWQWRRNEP